MIFTCHLCHLHEPSAIVSRSLFFLMELPGYNFWCNILACAIFYYPTMHKCNHLHHSCRQCMLNDVLCNLEGAFVYYICVYLLCVHKMGGYSNVTPDVDLLTVSARSHCDVCRPRVDHGLARCRDVTDLTLGDLARNPVKRPARRLKNRSTS